MVNKQTAMIQMLEFINELGEKHPSKMHAVLCREKAIELLEVEKEQIINAAHGNRVVGGLDENGYFTLIEVTGEDYYKETYGKE
jgi:hypothetical protein